MIAEQGPNTAEWIGAGVAVATLVLLVVTAAVAFLSLWDARRTRHGELITELMRDWTEPALIEALALHGEVEEQDIVEIVDRIFNPEAKEANETDRTRWAQLSLVVNTIELWGALVSERAITAEAIYKQWGGIILTAWSKWDVAIRSLRVYDDEPDLFVHFEELWGEIMLINTQRKHDHPRGWSIQPPLGPG